MSRRLLPGPSPPPFPVVSFSVRGSRARLLRSRRPWCSTSQRPRLDLHFEMETFELMRRLTVDQGLTIVVRNAQPESCSTVRVTRALVGGGACRGCRLP